MINLVVLFFAWAGVFFLSSVLFMPSFRRALMGIIDGDAKHLPRQQSAPKELVVFSITKYGDAWMITTADGEQFVSGGGAMTNWYHYPSAKDVQSSSQRQQLRECLMAHIWKLEESGEIVEWTPYRKPLPKPAPKPPKQTGEGGAA